MQYARMMATIPIKVRLGLALWCALIFALQLIPREGWFVDDSFIFQSFIRNALDGHGWVYFPGQFVEGFSSPLWVALLTVIGLLGLQGLGVAAATGAVCGTIAIALPAWVPARGRLALIAGCLILACQPGLQWWSISGMETPLVVLLTSASAAAMLNQKPALAAAAAGLAAMARPEGAIYLLPVLAWILVSRPPGTWKLCLVMLVPAMIWQVFRWFYYGSLISNSALAKLNASANQFGGESGGSYLLEFVREYPAACIIFVAAVPGMLLSKRKEDPGQNALDAVLAMILLGVLFGALFGDWMPRGRLLVPILPLLVLWPLAHSHQFAKPWAQLFAVALSAACALTALQQFADYQPHTRNGQVFNAHWPHDRRPFRDPVSPTITQEWLAKFMLRYTVPGDRVLNADIGQSGYLANDVDIRDLFGLVSRHEAEYLAGKHSDDEYRAYFRAQSPAVVFVETSPDGQRSLLKIPHVVNPELWKSYTMVAEMPWARGNLLMVFVRNDAVARKADPQRLHAWQAASPSIRFREDFLLSDN